MAIDQVQLSFRDKETNQMKESDEHVDIRTFFFHKPIDNTIIPAGKIIIHESQK